MKTLLTTTVAGLALLGTSALAHPDHTTEAPAGMMEHTPEQHSMMQDASMQVEPAQVEPAMSEQATMNTQAGTMNAQTGMSGQATMSTDGKMTRGGGKMVGGANMSPKRTIAANASKANNLTTLVTAVQEAGLVDTLNTDGPFTVFAPTNDAFAEVQSTVDTLLQPENKQQLQNVLTYHVVAADLSATDLLLLAQANDGMVRLNTVSGDTLTVMADGNTLTVRDESGNTANIIVADVNQSNGVVHVVDHVLIPS